MTGWRRNYYFGSVLIALIVAVLVGALVYNILHASDDGTPCESQYYEVYPPLPPAGVP